MKAVRRERAGRIGMLRLVNNVNRFNEARQNSRGRAGDL
jgi:hypothetical protein